MYLKKKLSGKRILVTGGAGFIGSHLSQKLADNNQVVILDNLSSGNIKNVPKSDNVTFVNGDIRDCDLVDKLVKKSDLVFHLAEFIPNTSSFGSGHVVKYSVDNPLLDFDVSTRGTLIVLTRVNKHKKRLIFSSTAAVYGNSGTAFQEDMRPCPASPYGASKFCAEEYINLFNRIYETSTSILRLFNVYGPRQTKYVMYDTLVKLKKNPKSLSMLGSGREERDFVFVKDAVDAFIKVAESEDTIGQTYNLGTGNATTIKSLIDHMTKLLSIDPEVEYQGESWKGDVSRLVPNITKILNLGFKPQYSLTEGLTELIEWFSSNID